jgi:hypothetical protein
MKDDFVLVSFRVRTTGRILGCPVALPPGIDRHLVPTSDVIALLADATRVSPEEVELLDLWSPGAIGGDN